MPDNPLYSTSAIQFPSDFNPILFRRENLAIYYGGNTGKALQWLLVKYIDFLLTNQHAQQIQLTILPEGGFIVQDVGATIESIDVCGLPSDDLCHMLAAAQHCTIELHLGGYHYQLSYNGEPIVPALQQLDPSQQAYRRIQFEPDQTLFRNRSASIHQLLGYLRGLAVLFPGCRIEVIDSANATTNQIFYPNGLRDYLDELIYHDLNPQPYLEFEGTSEHVQVKLGIRFSYFSQIEQCLLRYRHVPFEPNYRRGLLNGLAAGLTSYGRNHDKLTAYQTVEADHICSFGCLIVLDQLSKKFQDAAGRPSDHSAIELAIQQIVQQQLPGKLAALSESEVDALVMWL